MLHRSFYSLRFFYLPLNVKLGHVNMKKLPLVFFNRDFSANPKELPITQCRKLPNEIDSTKGKHDNHKENLVNKPEKDGAVEENNELSEKLVNWAMQNNVSYLKFSRLLKILHESGLKNLPKNSKVLCQAKENEIDVHQVPPGVYYHFSLEKNLKLLIEHILTNKNDLGPVINISVFIDEVLLSTTNRDSLWVILTSVCEFEKVVFAVGAYRGPKKPDDSNLFLSYFVEEVTKLCNEGLTVNEKNYKIALKRVICDALAKAFILNVQSHSGYSSCTKCWVEGEHINKICFPGESNPKTDKDFEKSSMYKSKKTELLKIPNFGVVSNIPLDYMHLVCFGVVRRLLTNLSNKIPIQTVSKKIKELHKLYEFQHKPKSLESLSSWDDLEFRRFLLYHGPVVLHGRIHNKYYDNFLNLHVACRLLCMNHSEENAELGKVLLDTFIKQYRDLYGSEEMSHNVHGLHHLVDDYLLHGTLDNFSSFLFEKFLSRLRRLIKKSKKKTLPQLLLKEAHSRVLNQSLLKLSKSDIKLVKEEKTDEGYSKYAFLFYMGARITPSGNESFVLLNNNKLVHVVEIFKKDKQVFISGKEFTSVSSFYEKPLDSTKVKIFQVDDLSKVTETWPVWMIDRKCVKVPIGKGKSVLIGLLNESY